ncbi:hypothetical protein Fcan01_28325 [Folsomia candida]|uniref:Ionotropic glutamate receptor C-terminal domain-containing protein n=1 Tax=Folsomia candida TaxID=158441 RepID=A0A226CWJ6_FOLCA|nr:hypothetical protein Fcan01_28325 [Folsomia candida]
MAIVTINSNRDRHDQFTFWAGYYFRISVLFMAQENQLKVCVWFRNGLNRNTFRLFQNQQNSCDAGRDDNLVNRSVLDITKEFTIESPKWRIYQPQLRNILQIIFTSANETLNMAHTCQPYCSSITDGTSTRSVSGLPEDETTFVITDITGLEFLTCYRDEYITFQFYITPFKPLMWVMLSISVVTIIVVTTCFTYLSDFDQISASIWLFVLATIFEEAGSLPRKMERRLIFRLVLGSWCLMSVLLTNCYNGVMITELNAPHKAWNPTVFDHLVCKRMQKHDVLEEWEGIDFYLENYINMIPLPVNAKGLQKYGYNGSDKIQLGWCFGAMSLLMDNLNMRTDRKSPRYTHFQEFVNPFAQKGCFHLLSLPNGYVSGFPDLPEFLHRLYKDLIKTVFRCDPTTFKTQPGTRIITVFYKGKETMDTAITGWRLYQRDLSKVPKKFKAVIESGIYWRLQIEATHQKYLLRRPLIRLEPYVMHAELNGAFSTLFVLCGGTVILATLVALVEIPKITSNGNPCNQDKMASGVSATTTRRLIHGDLDKVPSKTTEDPLQ